MPTSTAPRRTCSACRRARVFEALQVYLGSAYVNDFNLLGRTFRVTAQADAPFRDDASDIARLETRSELGRDGADRRGRDLRGPDRPVSRDCATTSSRRSRSTARPPGLFDRPVDRRRWSGSPRNLPAGFSAEWTDIAFQQKAAGNVAALVFGDGGGVRLPRPRRAVREPAASARDHPDRADDPARGDGGREPARHGQQHPDPDRPDRADRPRRQERDPDRRIRQAGRGAGRGPGRGGGRGGAAPAAADPDDQLRLHPRRAAAGHCVRRRLGAAPGARHRGLLRDDRRDLLRPGLHPGLLRRAARAVRLPRLRRPAGRSRMLQPAE